MPARLTFLALTAFWVTMNVLLWRTEFGVHSDDYPIPAGLVWRKILTAPDASSLSVYENRVRTGYCEFSTAVGQQMATMDENRPPPEGLGSRAGYQIHVSGNIALIEFTNRIKFDGHASFTPAREWSELVFRLNSREGVAEVRSLATNQTVHLRFTNSEGVQDHLLTFAELKNPALLIRALGGNFADLILDEMDLPSLDSSPVASLPWTARRTRLTIGSEPVPIYQLETTVLGRTLTINVSTIGEILEVTLPGEFDARIDELPRP